MPMLRIPYTDPLPAPRSIIPASASTFSGAVAALAEFLTAAPRGDGRHLPGRSKGSTVLLTGAGISVASGLADYRGTNGTYMLNKSHRPIYYHEFTAGHNARRRYWARSFLGWTNLNRSRPNDGHLAVRDLGALGLVESVITQSISRWPTLLELWLISGSTLQMLTLFTPLPTQGSRLWNSTATCAH